MSDQDEKIGWFSPIEFIVALSLSLLTIFYTYGETFFKVVCASIGLGILGYVIGFAGRVFIQKQLSFKSFEKRMKEIIKKTIADELSRCQTYQESRFGLFNSQQSEALNKLDAILRSHALHTRNKILEKYLRKMEDEEHSKVRWIIAKLVSEKLSDAFKEDNENILTFKNVGYAKHAELFEELVYEAENIYLTCVYHPKAWFDKLKERPTETYQSSKPDAIWYNYCNNQEYPSHFMRFLDNPRKGKRMRVFLLNKPNWDGMLEKSNLPYFLKFIGPSEENNVQTFFVNMVEAGESGGALYGYVMPFNKGDDGPEDYNVFDLQAVVTYRELPEGKDELELRTGNIFQYNQLFNLVIKRHDKSKGIYTFKNILDFFKA